MTNDEQMLDNLPPIINAGLSAELMKHPFPMENYQAISVSWPYKPEEIRALHQWMALRKWVPKH